MIFEAREETGMKFYLAARYSRREELAGYAEQLRALGHEVTSRWLEGNHQISDAGLESEEAIYIAARRRFAREDIDDLLAADVCVSFTETPRSGHSRGGRHVEFGVAIADPRLDCVVIGPRENVFHCLDCVRVYASWDEYLHEDVAYV